MHDEEIEAIILSHLLMAEEPGKVFQSIGPMDFYSKAYSDFYRRLNEDYTNGLIDTIRYKGTKFEETMIFLMQRAGFYSEDKILEYCHMLRTLRIRRDTHNRCLKMIHKCNDPDSDIQIEVSKFADSLIDTSEVATELKPIGTFAAEFFTKVEAAERGEIIGFPTGLRDFDQQFGGIHNGLYLLAGRPGMGKTSLAQTIAANGSRSGKITAFFSMEMEGVELFNREISALSGIAGDRFFRGNLSRSEHLKWKDQIKSIQEMNIYIDESTCQRASQIRTKSIAMKRSKGLDLVVVDNAQIATGDNERQSEVQVISALSRGLKNLSKDLKIPVLLVSHLNRKLEERSSPEPKMSDLKGSGSLEQDANGIIFVHNPGYFSEEEPKEKVKIILPKMRGNPTGFIWAKWDGPTTRFSDWEEVNDWEVPPIRKDDF